MKPKYELVTTEERLDAWLLRLETFPIFAIDTETTGFNVFATDRDPRKDCIVGVSLAVNDGDACYIPVRHNATDAQLDADLVFDKLRPILQSPQWAKVFHNGQFDIAHFRNEGIIVRNVHDTQLMSFALKGGTNAHNMDDLAWEHLRLDTSKFNDVTLQSPGIHQTFADVRLDHATYYAAEDTDVTLQLFKVLRRKLKEQNLWDVYSRVDRIMPEIVAGMQYDGVRVDTDTLKRLQGEFMQEIFRIEDAIFKLVGPVNLGSHNELRELLFSKTPTDLFPNPLGITPRKLTKSGAPSTDADALEAMAGEHPVLDLILEWRAYNKLLSTYVVPLPREISPEDGRIHPHTNLTFTRTSRLSMSDPSLHQIPAKANKRVPGFKAGIELRKAFIAEPGYKLIVPDYSQIEVRVLAHVTGETAMIEAFHKGYDFHAANAAAIFGGSIDQYMDKKDLVRQGQRSAIKAVTFGLLYGAGPKKIASEAKISEEEAKKFIAAFFEGYQSVSAWIKEQHQLVHQDRAVYTLMGRRLPVDGAGSDDQWLRFAAERRSVNYVIQGTAAELNRLAMQAVHADVQINEWDARTLLSVHDELVIECAEDQALRFAPIVGDLMEHAADDFIEWRVPIIAEPGIGSTWYEAKNDNTDYRIAA
jgi:DNA polymerase-1